MIRAASCILLAGIALAATPGRQPTQRPPQLAGDDAARQFEQAVTLLDARGEIAAAARLFEAIANGLDRALAARALVYLGDCYERLGDPRARGAYARVVGQFAEQASAVTHARTRLARLPAALPGHATALRLRRLWNGPPPPEGEVGNVSLNGRSLALFDAQGVLTLQDMRTGRIGVRRPLGRTPRGLPCMVEYAALAPDASAVVFTCKVQGEPFELRWASLRNLASAEHLLHRVDASDVIEPLEWRRTGEILARVSRSDRSSSLVVVPVPAGRPRTIVSMPWVTAHASMSPDGRWVAYDGPDAGTPPRHDVLVAPTGAGTPRIVVGGPSDDLMPIWAADGQRLTWVSDRTGTSGLWLQAFEGGTPVDAPRLVAPDLGRVAQVLGLASSGAYAYFRQTGLVDVHTVQLDATGHPVGPPAIEGTRYVGATMWSTWSPDGDRLAYRVELGVSRVHAIGIRDVASQRERVVTPAMLWIDMPRWSPDARRLLVRGISVTNGYGFFLVDVDTGATTALKTVPLMEEDTLGPGQWDASGQAIIYVRRGVFFRLDVDTRQEVRLFALPEGSWLAALPDPGFSVSPDDGRLAYLQVAGGVTSLMVREPDGISREVVRSQQGERLAGVAWGARGGTLFFTRLATGAALSDEQRWPAVWTLDLMTQKASAVGISMPRLRGLAVGPDGTRLAFTSGSPTREPWILEHFLPSPRVPPRPPAR